MPHLLLVDDDPNILRINRDYFESRGFCVTACETADAALEHAEKFPVDCVILDIVMPKVDGFELCKRIKAELNAPVIFLTGFTEREYLYQGFELGGDDFLTKPCDLRELEARINARIRSKNSSGKPPSLLIYPSIVLDLASRKAYVNDIPVPLTAYEFDILFLLASAPKRIFSPKEIYQEVWKLPDLESTQTVKVHVARMRHKLEEICPGRNFIGTAWKQGYNFLA